jgi:N-acetylneuraminic acid mutarotase
MKNKRYLLGILFCFSSSVCLAQWTQETPYPGQTTDAVVAFAIGDTIYIGGGSSGATSFYKFDPSTEVWTQKGSITPCAFEVSFAIGSNGYMGLGQTDPQGTAQLSITNALWEYDPATDHWTKRANFPGGPRDAAFAFVIGGKAYVGGGLDTNDYAYDDFYSYDPSTDSWDTLGRLPDYIYFNSTFVLGNYGYVATGVIANIGEVSSVWKYDPSNDSWETMSDFPGSPRESAIGFALEGQGYIGLGQSDYTSVFSDFYSYDSSGDQWTLVSPPFPGKHGEGWACAVSTTNSAFLGIGTYFVGQELLGNNDFWLFAPSTAAVATAPTVSAPNVYPNPTLGNITLSLPQNVTSYRVMVQNSIGATCLTAQAGADSHLDLSSLPAGIYNVEITSDDYRSNVRVAKM